MTRIQQQFKVLMRNMKHRHFKWRQRGIDRGAVTFDPVSQFEKQGGKCFYSKIQLKVMSPERINNDLGYQTGNVVLVDPRFQFSEQKMSQRQKRFVARHLINKPSIDNLPNLFKNVQCMKKTHTRNKFFTLINKSGRLLQKCNTCETFKYPTEFNKGRRTQCKLCDNKIRTERKNNMHGFVLKLIADARKNAKIRGTRKRNVFDRRHEVDGDIYDQVLGLLESQKGYCALTSIPMTFQQNDPFQVSLDRLNDDLGYIRGNLRLVISCVNTNNSFK